MLVTLKDGKEPDVLDTESGRIFDYSLSQHAMKFHVVDKFTRTATDPFVIESRDEQDAFMKKIRLSVPHIRRDCTWVYNKKTRKELWNPRNFQGMDLWAMAQKDLDRWWGKGVCRVTGTKVRFIYYVSDGKMNTTPDAIGKYKGAPLIYKGYAVATIFTVGEVDALQSDRNIVHWLPRAWWDGFHNRYRRVPKDFPGTTGFVCTKWCQRDGNKKGNGIWLASMTQGQTLGGWSFMQLPAYLGNYDGIDILGKQGGKIHKTTLESQQKKRASVLKSYLLSSAGKSAGDGYGMVGTRCYKCGSPLVESYAQCKQCGTWMSVSDSTSNGTFCISCGRRHKKCSKSPCSDPSYVEMLYPAHEQHLEVLLRSVIKASKMNKGGNNG